MKPFLPLYDVTVEAVADTLFGPMVRHIQCKGSPTRDQLRGPGWLSLYLESPDLADLRGAHTVNVVVEGRDYHGVVQNFCLQGEGIILEIKLT